MVLPLPTGWSTQEFNDFFASIKASGDAEWNWRLTDFTPPYMQSFVQQQSQTGSYTPPLPLAWESQEFTDYYNELIKRANGYWNSAILRQAPPYIYPNVVEAMGGYAPPNATMFNFMTGVLPAGVTLTRATAGWYFDATGTLQQAAINVPRFTYPFQGGPLLGLLNEPASINLVVNAAVIGAVAGTPGTFPPPWLVAPYGLSSSVIGFPIVNGMPCLDIRYFGTLTPGNNGLYPMLFDSGYNQAVTPGSPITLSYWLAVVGGSLNNVSNINLVETFNAGGDIGGTADNLVPALIAGGSTLQRFLLTGTVGPGATGTIGRLGASMLNPAAPVDFTLRYGAPLQEQLPAPTSPIITPAGATLARAADVLTIPLPAGTFTMWITRQSGVTAISGVAGGGNWQVPTDPSPIMQIMAQH